MKIPLILSLMLRSILRRDFGAAKEGGVFVDHQAGRFYVALQRAAGLKFATFRREDVAFDCSADLDRFGPDFAFDCRMLADRQRPRGINRALYLAIDDELIPKFDRAFDRNSS